MPGARRAYLPSTSYKQYILLLPAACGSPSTTQYAIGTLPPPPKTLCNRCPSFLGLRHGSRTFCFAGEKDQYPLAHHPLRMEFSLVTMMLGNDYFPGLAMRRDRLLKIFLDRYRHNLDADGHWAVKDDLITCKKGIRREVYALLIYDGG